MSRSIFQTDATRFDEDVLKSDLPVLVYFFSDDCPPCLPLTPLLERMAEIYGNQMKFVKIFRQHNRQLADSFNVKSSPTIMFFRDGQEVCARLNGYISKQELLNSIEAVIGRTCPTEKKSKVFCDVLVLGAGPAGLSAAIYTGRAKMHTMVVEEGLPGGQVLTTYYVANYPGTNGVIRGIDLVENMKRQALSFGAVIDDMKKVVEVDLNPEIKYINAEDTDYYAKSVIIATGAEPRKLPAEGEKDFRGRGVHYCASCDGAFYQDADIIVVGGGNSAVEEAVFLTRFARHVTIVHRLDHFQASKGAQDEVLKNPNISVIWNSEVRKINGDNFVKSVIIEDLKTKEQRELKCDGVFVYIGMEPRTALFKDMLKLNEQGYIITDENMRTNIPGVFAAGDCRDKKVRQIASAVGDGVIAGIMAERYVIGK